MSLIRKGQHVRHSQPLLCEVLARCWPVLTSRTSSGGGALRANMIQRTATCSGVSQGGTSFRRESFKERLRRIRERRPSRNMPAWLASATVVCSIFVRNTYTKSGVPQRRAGTKRAHRDKSIRVAVRPKMRLKHQTHSARDEPSTLCVATGPCQLRERCVPFWKARGQLFRKVPEKP